MNVEATKVSFLEIIKHGIKTLNRNYQLLLIHSGVLILAFFLFIIIVGIPLIMVTTKIGLDISQNRLMDFAELFLKGGLPLYKYLILTLLLSLLIYILTVSVIFIYVLAGTAGIIMKALSGEGDYRWRSFAQSAKDHFGQFLRLGVLWIGLLIIISFIVGALSGITKVVSSYENSFLRDLFTNLFNLTTIIFSLGAVIFFMALFTYAGGFIILKKAGPLSALRKSINFIFHSPLSLFFYALLSIGAVGITLLLGTIGLLFKGNISIVLYQMLMSFVQIYLNLSILACAFTFLQRLVASRGF